MRLFARKQQVDSTVDDEDVVDEDSVHIGTDIDTGQRVSLPFRDWFTHVHSPGAPGTGKTSFLELLCRQLIMLGRGLTVIDPLGVLVIRLLVWLSWNPQYAGRVVLVSPDTALYYAGFAPLKPVDYLKDGNAHSAWWADIMKKAARDDANLPRFTRGAEDMADPLRGAGLTPLEMTYFYQLDKVHALPNIIRHSSGDGVREEWQRLVEAKPSERRRIIAEELESIRNRTPRFIRNHFVRMTLGRTENTLDFRDVVENRIVLLIDTSPHNGVLARIHSFTLSSLFLGSETLYMRTRTQRQAEANPRWAICDGFHNILTPDMTSALDELRNFGWRSVLSHQRFGQLLREDIDLLDAVNTDAGIKAVFGRLNDEALRVLEPLIFMGEHDLRTPKYQTYAGEEAVPHYYTLQELEYRRRVELYRQPRQHMTWKVLEQPPRRVKTAPVQSYQHDPERFRALIEMIIRNHPQYYLHEDEVQEIITQRKQALEGSAEERVSFADTKRVNPRRRSR